MRILHLADLHINLTGPRAEECARVLDWIPGAACALDPKPDAIVIAGDIFDRRSTPKERIYLARFLCKLVEIAKTYLISGNHDDRDDLALFRKEYGWMTHVEVILGPAVFDHDGAGLAFLPWPTPGAFVQPGATTSIVDRREAIHSALVDILRGFRNDRAMGPNKPSLLVAHVAVAGASMDSGQPVTGGEEIALMPDELLESGAAGIALGHVHLRQQMNAIYFLPIHYAGAPFRTSFGEATGQKGGLLWDWSGKAWEVSPWETPARKMSLIDRAWTPPEMSLPNIPATSTIADADIKDADVRIRITFPAESREAMRAGMAMELDNLRGLARSLTVEERPVVISRTRCVEITKARTPLEKLKAWAESAGIAVPEGIEVKLEQLEKETRA